MLFNSIFFLFVYFPMVVGLYYLLPHRFRWGWLLFASCYFYMGFIPKYILILAFTITIDYFAGIFIEKLSGKNKRYFLILSIVSNIGILFVFKYFNFFNANLSALAELLHWNYSISGLSLILPIGLSFHTFQSLSYIIEVYRGKQKAERNFGILALYVMFFPQLVAGPIERPQNLLHQFRERHHFVINRFISGMKLIAWGLFKKVVIADRVSVFVNQIFNNVHDYSGSYFILGTFFFAFQIYCDFSGYSDMARGLAKTFGYELMINFDAPYFSKSIAEFWRRWHISLSTWFRDYVYIPLGGNRVSATKWQLNLFITFLLSGIWHGANWTFVIWGSLNGVYLIISLWTKKFRDNNFNFAKSPALKAIKSLFQVMFTFILISLSWVFFRAQSLADSWYVLKQIFSNGLNTVSLKPYIIQRHNSMTIAFLAILFLMLADYFIIYSKFSEKMRHLNACIQVMAYVLLIIVIMFLGQFTNEQFIYFQF